MFWFVLMVNSGPVRGIRERVGRRVGGQSTVEYALVGALVVIAAATALTLLGEQVNGVFAHITSTLRSAAATAH